MGDQFQKGAVLFKVVGVYRILLHVWLYTESKSLCTGIVSTKTIPIFKVQVFLDETLAMRCTYVLMQGRTIYTWFACKVMHLCVHAWRIFEFAHSLCSESHLLK